MVRPCWEQDTQHFPADDSTQHKPFQNTKPATAQFDPDKHEGAKKNRIRIPPFPHPLAQTCFPHLQPAIKYPSTSHPLLQLSLTQTTRPPHPTPPKPLPAHPPLNQPAPIRPLPISHPPKSAQRFPKPVYQFHLHLLQMAEKILKRLSLAPSRIAPFLPRGPEKARGQESTFARSAMLASLTPSPLAPRFPLSPGPRARGPGPLLSFLGRRLGGQALRICWWKFRNGKEGTGQRGEEGRDLEEALSGLLVARAKVGGWGAGQSDFRVRT